MNADPLAFHVPKPRNRRAFAAGQEVHSAVRAILVDMLCPHCRRPPAAKEVLAKLPAHLRRDARTIRTHIRDLMTEIGERCGTVSLD